MGKYKVATRDHSKVVDWVGRRVLITVVLLASPMVDMMVA